jgi:D-alanine-D-alanine ligase
VPSNEFYDYDAKYVDGTSTLIIPAELSPAQSRTITDIALQAFRLLDLAGLARVDFLVESGPGGRVFLNEANTMPGFTSISMYPRLWAASGLPYPQLLRRLIDLARERHQRRSRNSSAFATSDWYRR